MKITYTKGHLGKCYFEPLDLGFGIDVHSDLSNIVVLILSQHSGRDFFSSTFEVLKGDRTKGINL